MRAASFKSLYQMRPGPEHPPHPTMIWPGRLRYSPKTYGNRSISSPGLQSSRSSVKLYFDWKCLPHIPISY